MNAICLICYKPNNIWFEFLSRFIHYNIYIIIDDNTKDYVTEYVKFKNIHVIQINNKEVIDNGFDNVDIKTNGLGWSKAIYYFSSIQKNNKHVWFIEEDIFFYNEMTLVNIDSKYIDADLLSRGRCENITGERKSWHWSWININLPPPYYFSLCPAVRISSNILSKIKDYANSFKTLFYLEALYPTICNHYKYNHKCPIEFLDIYWEKDYWQKNDIGTKINKSGIFHPLKDLTQHTYYRNILDSL